MDRASRELDRTRLPRVLIETSSIMLGWSEFIEHNLGLTRGQKRVQKLA